MKILTDAGTFYDQSDSVRCLQAEKRALCDENERLRHENMRLSTANEYAYGPSGELAAKAREIERLASELTRREHEVGLERAVVKRMEASATLYWGEMAKLQAEIERLTAALRSIAAEADGARLSANDDELRDWLMAIRDKSRAALEGGK